MVMELGEETERKRRIWQKIGEAWPQHEGTGSAPGRRYVAADKMRVKKDCRRSIRPTYISVADS